MQTWVWSVVGKRRESETEGKLTLSDTIHTVLLGGPELSQTVPVDAGAVELHVVFDMDADRITPI